ncbi:hypothetical protein Tco_0286414 [Tanacetum coccineum]
MEALTTRIDSQFKEIRGDMKEMRDGCNKCGEPHPSSDCDDRPMGGPKEEKANYASGGYRGGYRGNYYVRNSSNWCDRYENQNSALGEENPPIPRLPGKKPDELEFEKTMREFNHQAAIQDLETKFGRISDKQSLRPTGTLPSNTQTNPKSSTSKEKPYRPPPTRYEHVNVIFTRSGKTYNPSTNPNTKTAVFLDDSEAEAEEVEKEVRINVPLIDVLAGMPNYGKFLKDLVSNKIEYLALVDLGTSINLMSYSLYAALSGTTLKPTRMNFVILQMEDGDRVPLILGRPFLHTVDAIIRVKNKELNLGIREDRATFDIDKAMQLIHPF